MSAGDVPVGCKQTMHLVTTHHKRFGTNKEYKWNVMTQRWVLSGRVRLCLAVRSELSIWIHTTIEMSMYCLSKLHSRLNECYDKHTLMMIELCNSKHEINIKMK